MTKVVQMPIVTVVLLFGFAFAQPMVAIAEEEPQVPAKAQFQLGLEHYQNKDFLTALAAFEASYRLRKSAAALFNIAMCQNAVFRYIESYESFLRLLAENRFSEDDEMKKLAETAMADILRKVGTVTLEGLTDETKVSVDGEARTVSEKDAFLLVEPGAHTIIVSKPGYLSKQIGVVATPGGHVSIEAALIRDPSAVSAGAASIPPFETAPAPEPPPQTVVAPFETAPSLSAPPHQGKGLLTGGLAAALTGVAGISIGIAFGAVYKNSHDDALDSISKSNEAVERQNKADYDQYFPLAASDAKGFAENGPKYRAIMIAGFAVGGTALAVGAVLLGVHARNRREKPPGAMAWSLDGVSVTF